MITAQPEQLMQMQTRWIASQLDMKKTLIGVLPDVLNQTECKQWIERILKTGLELAPVITPHGTEIIDEIRNNRRVIIDDTESAKELFERVQELVPQEIHGARLVGVNERFRCYEYQPGQRFAPHSERGFCQR